MKIGGCCRMRKWERCYEGRCRPHRDIKVEPKERRAKLQGKVRGQAGLDGKAIQDCRFYPYWPPHCCHSWCLCRQTHVLRGPQQWWASRGACTWVSWGPSQTWRTTYSGLIWKWPNRAYFVSHASHWVDHTEHLARISGTKWARSTGPSYNHWVCTLVFGTRPTFF
jgi:hypothetical protein